MRASRVVVVSHTAQLGGAETAMLRLLDALDRECFDVRVVLFDDGELRERLAARDIPVEIVALGRTSTITRLQTASPLTALRGVAGAIAFSPRLARALRRHRPHLVVANSLKSAAVLSIAAPLLRSPWVWHLHDRLSGDYLPKAAGLLLRVIAAAGPRRVVANSQATRLTLGRRGRARTTVAYPGLDAPAFSEREAHAADAIGMVGRISETKGQLLFVQAASRLLRTHPDARFRIVGAALFQDGDYEKRVRAAVDSDGLGDRVDFTGWVGEPTEAFAGLRLLVHASPVPEPFGQVVVEGMAAGIPVIATRAGGVPEVVDPEGRAAQLADGVWRAAFGLLVRPGDPGALSRAMEWALDHREECDVTAAAARASVAERFTIDATAAIVDSVWTRAARQLRPVVRG